MSEHKIPIPAMLYNAAVGGHVTNSQQIIDENLNREQNDINEEVVAVPYNASNPNGMGKIVLKKNDNFKKVVEEQTDGNTIFVIKYDFILTGNVTIPANCVLEFDGGSVSLGNYNITGSANNESLTPENFGAIGDCVTDDRKAIQTAINLAKTVILNGDYLVKNAPFDYTNYNPIPEDEINYYRDVLAQKNSTPDSALTPITIGSQKTIIVKGRVKAYSPLTNLFEINGNNSIIKGGGTIEGCGIVNSITVYSGTPTYVVTGWAAANIFIQGSNNIIEHIIIKNPTSQAINVYSYASKHNIIQNCIIGGGLINHTEDTEDCSFTSLFGIYSRGQGTVIQNNIFKRLDGKAVYSSFYCNYTDIGSIPDIQSRDIPHTIYENNVVEEVLEHGIYSYAQRLIIKNNTFKMCHGTTLQLFNGYNLVENNLINVHTIQYRNNAIIVSGEHQTIRGNKIYNCTGYGIRCQGYYNGSCDYDIVENNYIEVDMNGSFSNDNTNHTPVITFESSIFMDNKVIIDKITCRNNTIICSNPAHGRMTPIHGFIAVFGDTASTFRCVDILNNTITGTCAQELIAVECQNTTKESYVNIIGNTCLASGVLTSNTRYDAVILVKGCHKLVIKDNQIKHLATYDGLNNAGYILELVSDYNIIYNNDMKGQALANRNWLNVSGKIKIGYDNIVGGNMLEQIITISNGSKYTNMSFQHGNNVPYYVNIIPLNEYAKNLETTDPCKMTSTDIDYVTIGHTNNVTQDAIYKVQVVFYIV